MTKKVMGVNRTLRMIHKPVQVGVMDSKNVQVQMIMKSLKKNKTKVNLLKSLLLR